MRHLTLYVNGLSITRRASSPLHNVQPSTLLSKASPGNGLPLERHQTRLPPAVTLCTEGNDLTKFGGNMLRVRYLGLGIFALMPTAGPTKSPSLA
jgi:hypothetical protein